MPRLSIVVPWDGNAKLLEDSLVSVLENRPDDCQIIVVLGDVYDDPYDLQDEVCFVEAPLGAGPVTCVNLGIAAGNAPIVHVLAGGVQVSPGWAEAALARFDDPKVAAVAPLVLGLDDPDRVISAGMTYQSGGAVRVLGRGAAAVSRYPLAVLAPDIRAAFYRRSALELAGPFQGEVDDRLAAVDMAMTLKHAGLHSVEEPSCRVYASNADAPRTRTFRRALEAERAFWRWAPRAGWPRSLVSHAAIVTAECCASFPRPAMLSQLAGRLLGGCWIGSHRRHYRHITQLTESIEAPQHTVSEPHFHRNRRTTTVSVRQGRKRDQV